MRAAANHYRTYDQLREAVTTVHQHGKKLYLTCNTLPRDPELTQFPQLEEAVTGVDALILADLGPLSRAQTLTGNGSSHVHPTGIVNSALVRCFMMGKRAVLQENFL